MRTFCAISLTFFLSPVLVCATSLRHQTYPDEDYAPNNSSQMRMEDFIRNQHALTSTWRTMSGAVFESDRTPTSSHEAHQVSLASLLSGYYVTAVYMDDKCTTLVSAVAYELNKCIGVKDYFLKSAATGDAESETLYSDILCTAKESLSSYIDYTTSCAMIAEEQSTLNFVNSNGFLPSSLTMASIRLVHFISLSCVIASLPCSWSRSFRFPYLFHLTVFDPVIYNTALCHVTIHHIISSYATLSLEPFIAHYYIFSTFHGITISSHCLLHDPIP